MGQSTARSDDRRTSASKSRSRFPSGSTGHVQRLVQRMLPDQGRIEVFLSWSGERARRVALALRDWLRTVVNECRPWMSDEDIELGKAWDSEIQDALARATVGIICVTPENATSPWLNFEAGAISRQIGDEQFVIPLAIGFESASDVRLPLGRFQAVLANKEGARRIHEMLNRRRSEPLPAATMAAQFDGMWPKLQRCFKDAMRPAARPGRGAKTDELSELLTLVRGLARQKKKPSRLRGRAHP